MKKDEYQNVGFTDITSLTHLNRREFLKSVGGAIFIFFCIGDSSQLEAQRRGGEYPEDFNAYLRIGADGRVACFTGT